MFFKRPEAPPLPGSGRAMCEPPGLLPLPPGDGSIRELGWWHATWTGGSWHVVGPDPASSGFGELGGRVDEVLISSEGEALAVLVPYLGPTALSVPLDRLLPPEERFEEHGRRARGDGKVAEGE